jgi:transcriptional regulator with XRE-family HTH domain
MIESTAITRELGARLRDCRERVGLKASDVAATLGWPGSKVSRLETGNRHADVIDVAMFLGCCGVAQNIAKLLLDLAQQPDDGFWIRPHRKQLPDQVLTTVMNETTASMICNFQPSLVPGLLQTQSYAAEVMRSIITVGPEDVQARVAARLARQRLMSRPNPPQMMFFINEAALRCPVGGSAVMNEQLLHLVFITAKPQIKIRVVPNSVGAHAGMRGSFIFMGYTDRKPLVLLESEATTTLLEDREAVENYRLIRAELHRIALNEEESRSLLADLASEYDRAIEERVSNGGANHLA